MHNGIPASRILVVEDELAMRRVLEDCLSSQGYRVITAVDGAAGLAKAVSEKPDLVLLDVMLPKLDGFAVCKELRRLKNKAPVLMLTAKGELDDRVQGLDCGADDYLVKPFSSLELLARVRALLRRFERSSGNKPAKLKIGDTEVDFALMKARRRKTQVHLTAKEIAMLQLLAEAEGQPVRREDFLDVVWGYTAFPTTRTVDNHIASIRRKVEKNPDQPQFIQTVHGIGYRLQLEEQK